MQPGTLTLLAYIFILAPAMIVGFIFARRKMFEPYHKYTMTAITLVNWVLIGFVMFRTYSGILQDPGPDLQSRVFIIPTIHLITGGLAQLLATYLVIRMWFEDSLPDWFKVKKIKRYMRLTLILWFLTVALGLLIYLTFYGSSGASAEAEDTIPPIATEAVDEAVDETEQAAPPSATEEEMSADVSDPTEAAQDAVDDQAADDSSEAPLPAATEAVD